MTAKGLFLSSQHIPQDREWEPICSGSASSPLLCYSGFNFLFGQEHLPAGEAGEGAERNATAFLQFLLIPLVSLEIQQQ